MTQVGTTFQVRHVTVGTTEHGQRIDNFLLRQFAGVPKSHVYRLLRSGQVRVNGGRAKPERKLVAGDEVRLPPVRIDEQAVVRPPDAVLERLSDAIFFEDEQYLAVNKPTGLAAHGGSGLAYGAIEVARAWQRYPYLELAHRLDRDTSGILLFAKSRPALLRAQLAFRDGHAQKSYAALLAGRWSGGARDVDAALGMQGQRGGERVVEIDEEDGKPSHSRFTPEQRFVEATLCGVEIFSGRTHQIRVHAESLGLPVAGDRKYGSREQHRLLRERGLKRMFLHARALDLPAADGLAPLRLRAPLPGELSEFLARLQPLPS